MTHDRDLDRIRELIEPVTYRGMTLSVEISHDSFLRDSFILKLSAKVPDVNNPEVMVTASVASDPLPFEFFTDPAVLPTALPQAIWSLIEKLDAHERMEHLRIHGRPIYDPHPAPGRSATYPDFARPHFPPLTD